jgi:SAM-dependent methyltransferase
MNVYGAVNQRVFDRIPRSSQRVLDIGCGDGALGQALKARQQVTVTGVTFSPEEASIAAAKLDRVVCADLETAELRHLGTFDCVVASHVLEHVRDPAAVLSRAKETLEPGGVLLIALPNALHYRQRLEFVAGRFRYTEGGIMDRTHYRFFDWDTARGLVNDAGLELTSAEADGGFPGSRFLGPARRPLDALATRHLPALLGTQFVLMSRRPL